MSAETTLGIPTLDLARLHDPDPDLSSAERSRMDSACREWGFFQIVGHGMEPSFRADVLEAMVEFFALPREEKRSVERSASNPWGYYDRELTKQKRDRKEIFDFGPADRFGPFAASEAQWPAGRESFRTTMWTFFERCERIAYQLLSALALNLELSAEALNANFGPDHTSFLRLNAYPVLASTEASLGIHPHTDAGALTVLLQDSHAGLEVLRDGAWTLVQPEPEALVINIGDVVQVWSNDRYAAPVHRVRASAEQTRYSAPFFFNPAYATNYAPLVGDPRYGPINWGDFRAGRAAGDYSDQGEEIQISHFRL
jgi:isopenicillin N synthase-like dioxygenase